MINQVSVERIYQCLQTCGGQLIIGGLQTLDKERKYLSPTVIVNPNPDSKLVQEEIFGPVLYIVSYKSFDEVITSINNQEKPLAVYYNGSYSCKHLQRLKNETSSGNITLNGPLNQVLDIELGFGGVGQSGMGRIGGYESFKQFSNGKGVVIRS